MLTSGVSQYLHPDYLQPLPTTLDAKKSPLALLAQTCSSIGKDPSPSKPIIPPLDKKDKDGAEKVEDKRPNSRGSKGSSSESGRDSKPGFRTVPPKEIPPLVPIGGEKGSGSDSAGKSSVSDSSSHNLTTSSTSSSSTSSSSHNILSSSASNNRPVSATGSSGQRSASRSGSVRDSNNDYNDRPPSSISGAATRHSASASPPSSSSVGKSSLSAPPAHSSLSSLPKPSVTHPSLLPGLPSTHPLAAAYPHLSLMPGLSVDPALQSYHSALAAHSAGLGSLSAAAAAAAAAQSSALKAGAGGSALSPYVAYARVRTPSGATTLVPVCRDPYCTNCQLTMQNSHLSSACNAPGCSQCAHEKSLTSLTSGALAGLGGASLPILPPISSASSLASSMGLSSLHSLYPLAAHQGLPYVCSWVAGSEYCGKRFGTSEELLQHLRTHTSSVEASSLAASYSALGLHPGLAAAAAGHYPGSPLSPNSLRRSYPTSLSPVSSLLSANRYHPYKSPLAAVPPPPTQGLGPVSPYYPYSLYGQRLGAAAVP